MEQNSDNKDQSASLENTGSTAADENSLEGGSSASAEPTTTTANVKKKSGNPLLNLIRRVNIYVLLFILILVLAGGMILVGIQRNKKAAAPTTISTQSLSADDLKKLTENEQKVGDPKSTLSIESNAIFSGKVLVRDSLDVAGTIKVGGSLSLPGINVSGSSSFDQINANSLNVTGAVGIQGQLNARGLTISGGGSFGGPVSIPSLTVGTLQLTNALQITNHIDGGGGTPGVTGGAGLGGSDTAGKVNNVAPSSGCNTKITYAKKYNTTPFVTLTPANSAAATSNYYVGEESSNGFSICLNGTASGTLTFNYMVIE